MSDLTPKELADLRRWLGGMQSLAERENIYDGNASVFSIVVRVLPMLDHLAHMTEARDAARAEVGRLSAVVERVRALALNQSGPGRWARDEGWAAFVPAAELLAALDEEPQP